MDNIAGHKSSLSLVTNIAVLLLVVIWLIPTVGLLVSSFRDREQISETGWWAAMFPVESAERMRPEPESVRQDGDYFVNDGPDAGARCREKQPQTKRRRCRQSDTDAERGREGEG